MQSAREIDTNGWVEIKKNPISKVGVFEYSGAQISKTLNPTQIYGVYRPAEALSDPACIASFRLIPWIIDHDMLGPKHGTIPVDERGISGVTGEEIVFEDDYLKANVKMFSEQLAYDVQNGKKELSIGYACEYDLIPGEYKGQRYVAVQKNIRGNHLASVQKGRVGPDVAVLDQFKFTLDGRIFVSDTNAELNKKTTDDETVEPDNGAGDVSLRDALMLLQQISTQMSTLMTAFNGAAKEPDDGDASVDADTETATAGAEPMLDKKMADTVKAMDSKLQVAVSEIDALKKRQATTFKTLVSQINDRNALATELATVIGVFDHADKTLSEVASYGVKELGLQCEVDQEMAILKGYLKGRSADKPLVNMAAQDAALTKNTLIDEYFAETK